MLADIPDGAIKALTLIAHFSNGLGKRTFYADVGA
jgi:hypothetical protein